MPRGGVTWPGCIRTKPRSTDEAAGVRVEYPRKKLFWAGTMTVFEVAVVANPGGTSSESSMARGRLQPGDLRRRDVGRGRRADGAGDADGRSRARSADELDGAAGGPGRWRAAGAQDSDAG